MEKGRKNYKNSKKQKKSEKFRRMQKMKKNWKNCMLSKLLAYIVVAKFFFTMQQHNNGL